MALLAILVGLVLIVAAIRNTQQNLFAALAQDVPAFGVWAAAIFALALIGFAPGMRPVSRGLLALVLLVIVLRNYSAILAAFNGLATSTSSASSAQPAAGGTSASSGGSSASSTASQGISGLVDAYNATAAGGGS